MREARIRPGDRHKRPDLRRPPPSLRGSAQIFERLWSDARIVDIDLSRWHEQIALYVLGDHAAETTEKGATPLFIVEFFHPSGWKYRLPAPGDRETGPRVTPPIWFIGDFALERRAGDWRCALEGQGDGSPTLTIACTDIAVRQVPLQQFTQYFADRADPASRFIRPGLDALLRADRA